ncbi:fimbria/pilus outer membrane usher protein [Phyllobacterium sp. 628]|uniref:fimbria/pilus outer membrane usher protein n=1 Tax=Phyllobacterium sp. 628 TaxID=2718938 RepID=UPI001FCEEB70|nr:fimbria/pilus outer membrane usher protein [Phyllobacterium sp. 628]
MPQSGAAQDVYLEVFINDEATGLIGAFRQLPDGGLAAQPQELKDVGLEPVSAALDKDGWARVDHLPGVEYRVDIENQRLYVQTSDKARSAKVVDLNPKSDDDRPKPQSSYGAVLNYSLFASSDDLFSRNAKPFQGISGGFDARFFSPFGTLSQSFTSSVTDSDLQGFKRLNTTYTYSDTERLITYRAGDFISGGLQWTRPVYLGGFQVQRNFHLRSDLVTLPMPVISGSAAVPSTLEVYTQNVKTYSGTVPSGPFQVTNFPVFTGSGQAQIVLRDTLGRETKTTLPFYSSSLLLRKGLLDFSGEVGFPRRDFGTESSDYAGDAMGIATARYGVTDWLTLEGHFEGGVDLLNGGLGVAFPIGGFGVTSLAVAGSSHDGDTGFLVNGSVELSYRNYTVFARMQQAFGDYDDVASVSADTSRISIFDPSSTLVYSPRVPRSLAQVTVSAPGPFDRSNFNLSYTQIESAIGEKNRIVGASYSQSIFKNSSFYATAFTDLADSKSFGIFAGITIPFDNNINVSTGYEQTADGASGFVDMTKSERLEEGSYGWRLRTREGDNPDRLASASYRGRYARVQGDVEQFGGNTRASAQLEGAIAVAAGGVFATNRINDAFAVVDVGAPDVEVLSENRPVGKTNRSGKILVPDLSSYEPNTVAIDPKNLPVDATIGSTRNIVVPADRSGVVVDFHVSQTSASAVVGLVDKSGKPLEAGLQGHVDGAPDSFVIGYDGETFIEKLGAKNSVTIELLDGGTCKAQFSYQPNPGTQVKISNVVCL